MAEHRAAAQAAPKRPKNVMAAIVIVLVWIACALAFAQWLWG
jgi:hypothetical protein